MIKKKNKLYTLNDGRILTIQELSDLTGIKQKTLYDRLDRTREFKELTDPNYCRKHQKTMTAFERTYKDLSPELFKLLFGKW
jgi:DNA-directed RNA polymerase specialized sigma24 family protein